RRAARGTATERLSRPVDHVPSFLRAEGHAREVLLCVIALPGGFGTLDEIFETATLVPNGEDPRFSAGPRRLAVLAAARRVRSHEPRGGRDRGQRRRPSDPAHRTPRSSP